MYLWCAERYHWPAAVLDDQPLQVYVYLPVLWQALAHIQEDASRKARS